MSDSKFLEVAKQAALEAGEIIKNHTKELTLSGKDHFANFATEADVASENKIIEIITKAFPEHNIIAEESGTQDRGSEYSWVIDPIDGTIPFVDGISTYGVSIGILKNKKPFAGVINMVAQGEIYWAEEGKGAFRDGQPIHIREEKDLSQATIALELGHIDRVKKIDMHFKPLMEKIRYSYVFGSAVKALTSVAGGFVDGCLLQAHPWDFAAGAILVTEAGGKVTDPDGNEPDYVKPTFTLLCTNGLIHEQLIEALKSKPA